MKNKTVNCMECSLREILYLNPTAYKWRLINKQLFEKVRKFIAHMAVRANEREAFARRTLLSKLTDNKELFIPIISVNFGTVEMLLYSTLLVWNGKWKQKKIPFVRIFKEYAFQYLALQFSKKSSREFNNIRWEIQVSEERSEFVRKIWLTVWTF